MSEEKRRNQEQNGEEQSRVRDRGENAEELVKNRGAS